MLSKPLDRVNRPGSWTDKLSSVAEQFPMWRSLCLLLVLSRLRLPVPRPPTRNSATMSRPAATGRPSPKVRAGRLRAGDRRRQGGGRRIWRSPAAIRGDALFKKRNHDKAIEAYSKGIELDPDNVGFLNARGWAYENKGKDDLAMADYNLALQKRPNFPSPYNNRGTIYLRKGALHSALDDFNAAMRIKHEMYHRPSPIGAACRLLNKDYDAALADFAAAEALNPTPAQPVRFRCVTYTEMGKFDDALADATRCWPSTPNYHFALNNRAEAYIAQGQSRCRAERFQRRCSAINPNNMSAPIWTGDGCSRSEAISAQARADYRSAAYALTKFDDTRRRDGAQERRRIGSPR